MSKFIIGVDARCDNCDNRDKETDKCKRNIKSNIGCRLWKNSVLNPKEKPCFCHYPCENENCPKVKGSVCHICSCDSVQRYVQLTYKKKFCSECGRNLTT